MKTSTIPLVLLLVTLTACACATTEPATRSGLELSLASEPDELYINMMPGPDAGKPQPAAVKLVLTVRNPADAPFVAEAPTTQVVRFTVRRRNGDIVYHSGEMAGMAITPVRIDARSTASFPTGGETWRIDNLRRFRGETLTVSATFVPTGDQATLRLPVKEAH